MKKLLVIEDEAPVRANILELLKAKNFNTNEAENGHIGVQMALEHLPDLIICDVMMPGLDGYGVFNTLRQNSLTATIPFIFLTAKADTADLRMGMSLGADDYLTKPFRARELLQTITTRLEKQAILEKQQAQRLDQLRSSITLSLPHELRTPLNGIIGLSEVMIDHFDSLSLAESLEILEDIRASGNRLHRLIQNFLLYAKLEIVKTDSEQVTFFRSHQTLCANQVIAEEAILKACFVNREADLHLQLIDADLQIINSHLSKLIEELLDNAFKFSNTGSPVRITTWQENSFFVLCVSNYGRGMSIEQISSVGAHQQFERKLYEQQGSGLGLSIAVQIAKLYGGKLIIESIPTQQTTIFIHLPLACL
ncbi:response regulator [Nostoc flagelliforme FACHB-838]|uniref:histidine kinase n=1 Tax=Nostoc flagelliforme FACHB-838 TaxID=2692904 RepID=A0ABR8DX56_9NOSO|nr:response regulator [Nostoc flagelliforme]MBD2534052.1 response regulator [Nostoc flagelliforme FACHB-838]